MAFLTSTSRSVHGTIDWKTVGKTIAARYSGVIVIEGRSIEEAKKSLAVFSEVFCMSGETLQVYFLGTAGALPDTDAQPALHHGPAGFGHAPLRLR